MTALEEAGAIVFGGGSSFSRAAALLGQIDAASLVTAEAPLDEIGPLFERVRGGDEVKAMVRAGPAFARFAPSTLGPP